MALRKNCIAVFFLLMVVSVAFAHGPKAKGGKAKAAKAEAPTPEESAAEAPEGATEAPEGATDAAGGKGVIDVTKLGASGNGKTDSTKAFMEAWKKACTAGQHKILVPKGDYLVGPLEFTGPCKGAKITISLEGNLLGTTDLSKYKQNWIEVSYVDDFSLIGPGKIDGQGAAVWSNNKCHKSYNCKILPNSLVFNFVNNGTVSGVKLVNSKFFHMNIFQCKGFMVDGVTVNSPEDSPNTDGIHIGDSSSVNITDTVIGTGDDCISIGPGNKDITITGVTCGPGHGISVGSLGRYKDEKDVTGITVRNCVLKGTTNGIRIKSYEDSPTALTASQFTYENIKMDDVQNPIIIDQKYCPNNICTQHGNSKVTIKDVTFRNITGTSATAAAVSLLCTDKLPCDGVHLVDVNVKYTGTDNKTQAVCSNAHGSCKGTLEALACL